MIRATLYAILGVFLIISFAEGVIAHNRMAKLNAKIEQLDQESIRSGIYLRGFLDGAAFQETYRHSNPNTNENATLELDIVFPEALKAYDQTFRTNNKSSV